MDSEKKMITCTINIDKNIYDAVKTIAPEHGYSVEEVIVNYLYLVAQYGTTNINTIIAMQEAEALRDDPNAKTYSSIEELLEALKVDD